LKDWYAESINGKDTEFTYQVKEVEQEYNQFSKSVPYQIHPTTTTHSKLINTQEIALLFQESEEQALEQEIKKIEKEINQPLTDELKKLVSNFIQTYKERERGNKEIAKKDIKKLKEKLREEKFSDENIKKIIDYCDRLVKLEQERLQANIEINTNK